MPDSCGEDDFQVLTPSEHDMAQNGGRLWAWIPKKISFIDVIIEVIV